MRVCALFVGCAALPLHNRTQCGISSGGIVVSSAPTPNRRMDGCESNGIHCAGGMQSAKPMQTRARAFARLSSLNDVMRSVMSRRWPRRGIASDRCCNRTHKNKTFSRRSESPKICRAHPGMGFCLARGCPPCFACPLRVWGGACHLARGTPRRFGDASRLLAT